MGRDDLQVRGEDFSCWLKGVADSLSDFVHERSETDEADAVNEPDSLAERSQASAKTSAAALQNSRKMFSMASVSPHPVWASR